MCEKDTTPVKYTYKSLLLWTISQNVIWASDWLLFNTISAVFQLYHDENKFMVNEMMMRFALY